VQNILPIVCVCCFRKGGNPGSRIEYQESIYEIRSTPVPSIVEGSDEIHGLWPMSGLSLQRYLDYARDLLLNCFLILKALCEPRGFFNLLMSFPRKAGIQHLVAGCESRAESFIYTFS